MTGCERCGKPPKGIVVAPSGEGVELCSKCEAARRRKANRMELLKWLFEEVVRWAFAGMILTVVIVGLWVLDALIGKG